MGRKQVFYRGMLLLPNGTKMCIYTSNSYKHFPNTPTPFREGEPLPISIPARRYVLDRCLRHLFSSFPLVYRTNTTMHRTVKDFLNFIVSNCMYRYTSISHKSDLLMLSCKQTSNLINQLIHLSLWYYQ